MENMNNTVFTLIWLLSGLLVWGWFHFCIIKSNNPNLINNINITSKVFTIIIFLLLGLAGVLFAFWILQKQPPVQLKFGFKFW